MLTLQCVHSLGVVCEDGYVTTRSETPCIVAQPSLPEESHCHGPGTPSCLIFCLCVLDRMLLSSELIEWLIVQRCGDDSDHGNDHMCPSVGSAYCLSNSLQRLTMLQFRGGNVELTFVRAVLAAARFLVSLTVEMHNKP